VKQPEPHIENNIGTPRNNLHLGETISSRAALGIQLRKLIQALCERNWTMVIVLGQ
jgi:hypothetical protein